MQIQNYQDIITFFSSEAQDKLEKENKKMKFNLRYGPRDFENVYEQLFSQGKAGVVRLYTEKEKLRQKKRRKKGKWKIMKQKMAQK